MATTETRKERTSRIFRTILNSKGIYGINDMSTRLGLSYYQVYYIYHSKTATISVPVKNALLNTFPDLNLKFLETGEGEPFIKEETKGTENIVYSERPVSVGDLNMLLDRMTILFEKVQAQYERVCAREEKLIEYENQLQQKMSFLSNCKKNA